MKEKERGTRPITEKTSDPDKKGLVNLKAEDTKEEPLTCMDIVDRMRKEGKAI